MNIQIFGKKKCFDTKKAERWFKERRIKFQQIDLVRFGMSGGEFDSVLRAVGGDGAQGDLAIFGIGEAEAVTADGKIAAHRLGVRISLQQQSICAAVRGETVNTESAAVRAVAGKSLLAGEGEQTMQMI